MYVDTYVDNLILYLNWKTAQLGQGVYIEDLGNEGVNRAGGSMSKGEVYVMEHTNTACLGMFR